METTPTLPTPTHSQPTQEICETAATNSHWDGKLLAQSCSATYPDVYSIDRAGSRGVLWDVGYTWSARYSQIKNWFSE